MKKRKIKFFKKISLVDYLGLFLVAFLGIAFLFFFMRKSTYVNIRIKITDQDVLYAWTNPRSSYSDRFIVGDTETDGFGRVDAKIINVEKFNITSSQKVVYLDINLKTTFDKRTGLYYAKGKPLVYGTSLRFNFNQVLFDGIVTELPEPYRKKYYDYKYYEVKALVKGVQNYFNTQGGLMASLIEPEVVRTIKIADSIKNSNGDVLIEVEDIKFTPSVRIVTNDRGEIFKVNDPVYIDGQITLKVKAKVIRNETYVLDDIPLKIGETIPLVFDKLTIYPTVLSFKAI